MSLFRRKRVPARVSPSGAVLAEGWNGLVWGAPLSAFKDRFPDAHFTESGWWQTGQAAEPFCGVPMAITQYAFNARDQLCTVSFIPDTANREELSVAAVNELGPPPAQALRWTFGNVVAEVKLGGIVAILTHPKFADH